MTEGEIDHRSLTERVIQFPLVTMLIALAIFIIIPGTVAGVLELGFRSYPVEGSTIISELLVAAAMVVVYKTFIRRLGARPRDDLVGPRAGAQTMAGIGTGILLFTLIVGLAALLGVYRLQGAGNVHFLIGALIMDGIFPAVSEEILFRGILFRWIEELAGSWPALILSSLLFGASHLANPHASMAAAIGIALEGGLLLGGAYMLTRRLWFPMGLHAAWNVSQGEIFGIPVSGKPVEGLVRAQLTGPALLTGDGFGLEASPIAISIGTLFGIYLIIRAVRTGRLIKGGRPIPSISD